MAEVVVVGDPIDGITIHGPFLAEGEGLEWAEQTIRNETWWVVQLEPATQDEAYPPPFVVIDEGVDQHSQDAPVVVGPFLYEPDAVAWASQGNDRHVAQLWTDKQHAASEHDQVAAVHRLDAPMPPVRKQFLLDDAEHIITLCQSVAAEEIEDITNPEGRIDAAVELAERTEVFARRVTKYLTEES